MTFHRISSAANMSKFREPAGGSRSSVFGSCQSASKLARLLRLGSPTIVRLFRKLKSQLQLRIARAITIEKTQPAMMYGRKAGPSSSPHCGGVFIFTSSTTGACFSKQNVHAAMERPICKSDARIPR